MPSSASSKKRVARAPRCAYMEGRRRCPRPGSGNPPLCAAHASTLAEVSRPKRPIEVLAGALDNFLAGKPINAEATIGAATSLFEQWKMGGSMTSGYYPAETSRSTLDDMLRNVMGGMGGAQRPSGGRTAGPPPPPPPPPGPDPRIEIERRARQILGFAAGDRPTVDEVKDRRRKLAKKYHPDLAGGSAAKMAAVNDAADVLIAAIEDRGAP